VSDTETPHSSKWRHPGHRGSGSAGPL